MATTYPARSSCRLARSTTCWTSWTTAGTFSTSRTRGRSTSAARAMRRYRRFFGSSRLVWLLRFECPWQGGPPRRISTGPTSRATSASRCVNFCPSSPSLGYLTDAVEDPDVRLLVLTGDAGHGKTSLCAQVLSYVGMSPTEAADAVRTQGTGETAIATTRGGRPLYVLTDLSAVSVEVGSGRLRALLDPPDRGVAIVCANEGRLRNCVVADESRETSVITSILEEGIERGTVTSTDRSIHIVNLNYQSVAPNRDGLVDWALHSWAGDRRRWTRCDRCDAREICPIFANHKALSDDVRGPRRRTAVRDVFKAAERTGAVVTTRQALALIAHAISGGLVCSDVHRRYRNSRTDTDWQYPHLFHQALFGDRLTKQNRRQVPVIAYLRRLDPGRVARRSVDDQLDPTTAESSFLPPVPGMDDGPHPQSRRDAQRESEKIRHVVTFMRRLDYFDSESAERLTRMGLESGDDFVSINDDNATSTSIRDALLRGLEAVQGIHRAGEVPDFLVLDPAFFSHRNRAAVISRKIFSSRVQVRDQMSQWTQVLGWEPELPHAVEWSNRSVYVVLPGPDGAEVPVQLDLMRFELLIRWASGLRSRNQHEAEIRSLTNTLAALTGDTIDDQEINVLVAGDRRSLVIDTGNRIRSGSA